ncbi:hypothetical protein MSPP1_000653 [Malassezia sp. CBS 17886]|nr:hypothetical protein MSPP1_000653 [Malassezia sp. CBS 17886]
MFAPPKILNPEDAGTIEVFGVTLVRVRPHAFSLAQSTRTQSVLVALQELNISYMQNPVMPGAPELAPYSPFGTVPAFVHRPNSIYSERDHVALYEPLAIARYIDEVLGGNSPSDPGHASLMPRLADCRQRGFADTALLRVEVDQLSVLIMGRISEVVEDQYVKPYFALRNNGASHEDIGAALSENKELAHEVLDVLESVIARTQEHIKKPKAPFLLGDTVSWADVFLFPILRDYKATRAGLVPGEDSGLPYLTAWVDRFARRPSAQGTLAGSFASSV